MTLPNAKTPKQEPRPLSLVEEKLQQAQQLVQPQDIGSHQRGMAC